MRQATQRLSVVLIAVWLFPTAAEATPLTPAATFDRAVATAAAISDPGQHIDALARIAESRSTFGNQPGAIATWNEAARVAAEIGDPEKRVSNLRWIVEWRAAAGDLSGALATLEGIEHSSARAEALIAIATARAAAGSRPDAEANLREALDEARRLDPGPERDWTLRDIAVAQAEQLGDTDNASTVTEAINDAYDIAESRTRIAVVQAKSGASAAAAASLQAALKAADAVADADFRVSSLSEFVDLLVNAGEFDAALVVAKHIDVESYHVDALSSVAAAIALHNRVSEALALARTLPAGLAQAPTLLAIARVQRDSGNMDDAAATTSEVNAQIEQVPVGVERDPYYVARAIYQARAESSNQNLDSYFSALESALDSLADGKGAMHSGSDKGPPRATLAEVADAVAFAHAITNAETRLETLARIATPLLLSGDSRALDLPIREALATVDEARARDSASRASSEIPLAYIASTQVVARDYAGAKATARQLTESGARLSVLALVAWGEACTNDVDVAKKTLADAVADVREADKRQAAAKIVALVQARLGDPEQALATAEGIGDTSRRVDALLEIATGRPTFLPILGGWW